MSFGATTGRPTKIARQNNKLSSFKIFESENCVRRKNGKLKHSQGSTLGKCTWHLQQPQEKVEKRRGEGDKKTFYSFSEKTHHHHHPHPKSGEKKKEGEGDGYLVGRGAKIRVIDSQPFPPTPREGVLLISFSPPSFSIPSDFEKNHRGDFFVGFSYQVV